MLPPYRAFAFLALLLLSPLGFTLSGCGQATTNLVTGETTRGAYSWQEEVQIGTEANQQIIAQYGLYDDPQLASYVDRIGQEVLRTSAYGEATTPAEIRNTPFHFQLLDSDVVNAFALPGGYIYVTRGLLAFLDNEAQLAVVLGHEAGHVLARHSSQQAANAQLGQLGLLGAAVIGGVVGGGNVAAGHPELRRDRRPAPLPLVQPRRRARSRPGRRGVFRVRRLRCGAGGEVLPLARPAQPAGRQRPVLPLHPPRPRRA